jgi:hypothetical protein
MENESIGPPNGIFPNRPEIRQPNGIDRMQGVFGINGTQHVPKDGKNGNVKTGRVDNVEQYFHALFARMGFRRNIALRFAKPLRLASALAIDETSDVWCLTVDDGHWWTLANGAVTHNSHGSDAFRGLAMSWREPAAVAEDQPMRGVTEMSMEEAWKLAKVKQGEARI